MAIGLLVGWIVAEIRKRTSDAQVSITISLLSGYAAFVPADAIGASGILATVTAGIYMGIRGPRILPARTRLQGYFVWDILDFIINAILFVLIGLQLRSIVEGLSGYSAGTLGGYALAVTGVVVGTRLVWFFTVPYLIRAIDRRPAQRARRVGAGWRLVMAWSGMRGAVSLAVAIFAFMTAWGEVLFASALTTDATRMLAIGLRDYANQSTVYWNQLMAAAIVVSIPVVAGFLALQRYLVQGLTAGGVKQ